MELLLPALGLLFWTLVAFGIVFFILKKFQRTDIYYYSFILKKLQEKEFYIQITILRVNSFSE